jgi:hypothetical protein
MKHFVSALSNEVRHTFSIGLLVLTVMGVVGGGGAYLSTHPVHAAAVNGTAATHVVGGQGELMTASYFVSSARRLPRDAPVRLAALAVSFRAPVRHVASRHVAVRATPPIPQVQQTPPVTSTAPASSPVPSTGGNASIVGMIDQVFGPYAPSAISVARCESGLNPAAYNAGSQASGLFQILPSTWAATPSAGSSPFNAQANINAAHFIFARDGYSWREWSCR